MKKESNPLGLVKNDFVTIKQGDGSGDAVAWVKHYDASDNTYFVHYLYREFINEGDVSTRWTGAHNLEPAAAPTDGFHLFEGVVPEYDVILAPDGSLSVGCQRVNKDALRDLVAYLAEAKLI